MTRPFLQQFHCPNCKTWNASETLFSRWLRDHEELRSTDGYGITDIDYLVHKFRTHKGRDFQLIMQVEVKTLGAPMRDSQRDSLHIHNQLIRNRRETPTKRLKHQSGTAPMNVVSLMSREFVRVMHFGVHSLQFEGLGPQDSKWIKWDLKEVNEETLTKILRMDVDPDTLKPMSEVLRSHHRAKQMAIDLFKEETA